MKKIKGKNDRSIFRNLMAAITAGIIIVKLNSTT